MFAGKVYRWYQEKGLDPWDFRCPFYPKCSHGNTNFTKARPPLIGRRYAEGTLPRLLVVSSDPGSDDGLPDQPESPFTLSGPDPQKYPQWRHWNQTLELVWKIQRRFDPQLTKADATACFLHERAVKCCANNPKRREASKVMFNNCHGYISDELPVLVPDIVVTQGNRPKEAVGRARFHSDKRKCGYEGHKCTYWVLTIPGHGLVLWLHTYHPASFANYYRRHHKGYFSCYPELADRFIKDREAFRCV